MSEAASTPEGQLIEGRYRIIRKIAEGGMATVYQATDERLGRTVAIKIMHTQLAQGPYRAQFVERFRREAQSAAAIANPHIVQVYDTGETDGLDYLVMEFVRGVNLRREMNEQRTFTVRETLRIVAETLDGLAAAHRAGVVHRDIKPENILINERGHVQITDFGLAKAASQATLSSTGMLLGTAAYLAPEMIENNQATPQGDLYSVGIMAWEMLAGEVPFVSDNPVTLVFKHVHEDVPSIAAHCPGIDPKVAAFLGHLTARAVDARPADAVEAARELLELTSTLDISSWTYRRPPLPSPAETTMAMPAPPAPPAAAADAGTAELAAPPVPPAAAPSAPAGDAGADAAATATDAGDTAASASASAAASESTDDVPATQPLDTVHPTTALPIDDGAPTQAFDMSSHADGSAASQAGTSDTAGGAATDAKPRRHRSRKPLVIALVIVLLAAAGVAGGSSWWYFLGPGSYWSLPKPDDVSCPQQGACSIAGADWETYRSVLGVANIPYEASEEYSDDVAAGAIVSADPDQVGARIGKRDGTKVKVVVSKGVQQATVPADLFDITSANGTDVLAALQKAGFDNVTHDKDADEYSMELPEGAVISLTGEDGSAVEAGTTLDHNAPLTVALSKGPMPVAMPNVVGGTKDEMEAAFQEANLTANVTEQYDDKVPAGSVISTSQDPGAQLHWGDSVDVVVSKGPEMATIPSGLIGKQESDVTKQLKALGFDVKTDKVLGGLFGTVRSIKNGDTDLSNGGQVRLRDENGKATVITLTIV
ncbi:Stk1 family PASTA domain-containing Ser/Thr kinase [Bifidobacterium samirii]|uniref:non-specific serine/threonine protein kinase n=1 Tax=Bifidobacterium samirii TaxID=2306974 RepID=A0A430FEL5_9BIFI|nr:Stk1 family PASTA domain-containing Ser/Thr kinase [Bifidobacterium samirii]RSX51344.1 serine/threonine protein kinase [Bifidobacterium samirii]